jgi:hypothetical protein
MDKAAPFEWEVPVGGFRWVGDPPGYNEGESVDPSNPGLRGTLRMVPSDEWRRRRYQPLEVPALFRIFAFTQSTAEGVLAFANQYGPLGHHGGESFREWVRAASQLRFAIELWDALQTHDEARLRQIINIRRDEKLGEWEVHYKLPPSTGLNPDFTLSGDVLNLMISDEGDIWHAALAYVLFAVNSRLAEKATSQLNYSSSTDSLRFVLFPKDLLTALWLQFALSIDRNTKFRRCRICEKWFEISPDANRTTREFCSDACRARDYRKRKAAKAET